MSFPLKVAQPKDFTFLISSFCKPTFVCGRIVSQLLKLRLPNSTLKGRSLWNDLPSLYHTQVGGSLSQVPKQWPPLFLQMHPQSMFYVRPLTLDDMVETKVGIHFVDYVDHHGKYATSLITHSVYFFPCFLPLIQHFFDVNFHNSCFIGNGYGSSNTKPKCSCCQRRGACHLCGSSIGSQVRMP